VIVLLYYLLQEYDADFSELFKVAGFSKERIERTPHSYALPHV